MRPLDSLLLEKIARNSSYTLDMTHLLGREEVSTDFDLIRSHIIGRSILVTGAGGSIGTELCRQIAELLPKCLILYEISEYALYTIDLELEEIYPHLSRFAYLGNILEEKYLQFIIQQHSVETIYHAAAYKHVPLVENNPCQGVHNNVIGTWTVAKCAIATNVPYFVLISTDKAVKPTNVMGASKRVAELIIQGLADLPHIKTCFAIVRFGNILDSSGSVIPRFRQQIAARKPITLTHPDTTRYFMSITEAVGLVMQAGAMAQGGEIFLLDMGKPIRIYDLALQMIYLSGLEPEIDIPIQVTGLRPGEKIHEELLIRGNHIRPTKHPKIYCKQKEKFPFSILEPQLQALSKIIQENDSIHLIQKLQQLVSDYQSANDSLDNS